MDRFSLTKMVNGREEFFYSAKGVYEICRHSDMLVADAFYDAVYEVLEGLRTGYLSLKVEKASPLWQATRTESKETRKAEGNTIARFVKYARPKAAGTPTVIMSICRSWQTRRQGSPTGTKPTRASLLCFSFRKALLTLRCARAWKREDTTRIFQGLRGSGYITLPPSQD